MAEDITFVVHKEWLNNIAGLPVEQQDKIIADFVRYGCEMKTQYDNNSVVVAFVNMIKGRIDFSKTKYEEKIVKARKAGRKKKYDDEEVLRLAKEGFSAAEIADALNCSKSAIDHSEGWKRRND